jgi:chromosome segregation ATPase
MAESNELQVLLRHCEAAEQEILEQRQLGERLSGVISDLESRNASGTLPNVSRESLIAALKRAVIVAEKRKKRFRLKRREVQELRQIKRDHESELDSLGRECEELESRIADAMSVARRSAESQAHFDGVRRELEAVNQHWQTQDQAQETIVALREVLSSSAGEVAAEVEEEPAADDLF